MNQKRLLILVLAIVSPIEKLSNLFLFLFFIMEFFIWLKKNRRFDIVKIKKGFFNPITLLFFLTVILLKLRNPQSAWDKDLSLLIFPLYFSIANLKQEDILYFLKHFVYLLFLSLFFSCLYEFVMQYYFDNYVNLWKLTLHYNNNKILYFFHSVSERLDFHHIYLTLYAFIGFLIGLFILKKRNHIIAIEKWSIIISMIFFLVFSILSLSRMTIICFILLGIYYLYEIIISKKLFKKRKFLFLIGLISIGALISNSQFAKNQFNKISKDPRAFLFESSLKLSQNSFFIGYGTNKASELLQTEQIKNGITVLLKNSHNQYLDYLIGGGVLMLIIFITINIFLFNNFKQKGNQLAIMILLFFLIQLLTESLLYRYRGIVLYALFMSLLYNYKLNSRNIIKK